MPVSSSSDLNSRWSFRFTSDKSAVRPLVLLLWRRRLVLLPLAGHVHRRLLLLSSFPFGEAAGSRQFGHRHAPPTAVNWSSSSPIPAASASPPQKKLQLIQGSSRSWTMGFLEYIALVAQLSVDAIMLIALAAYLLRIPQCEAECSKLEEYASKLRTLLRHGDAATQRAAWELVEKDGALVETAVLLGSYRGSTLWCLVRTGRSMQAQLRGMQDRVNSLYDLVLRELVLREHADVLRDQASDTNAMNHHVIGDPLHDAETCDSASESQRYNGNGQRGANDQSDNTEPGGLESV